LPISSGYNFDIRITAKDGTTKRVDHEAETANEAIEWAMDNHWPIPRSAEIVRAN
jgi:hypothetical protein